MKENQITIDIKAGTSSNPDKRQFSFQQFAADYTINTGQWIYVLVTYSAMSDQLIVYANSVKVVDETIPKLQQIK